MKSELVSSNGPECTIRVGNHLVLMDLCTWKIVRNLNLYIASDGYVQLSKGFESNNWRCQLARFIMGPPKGMEADHIYGNKLDNRACNLRIVTRTQNLLNRKVFKNNKSGIRGVHKARSGKWTARISYKGVIISLGTWPTARIAEGMYKTARLRFFGTEFDREE